MPLFVVQPYHLTAIEFERARALEDYNVNYARWKSKKEVLTKATSMATYSIEKVSHATCAMLGLTLWSYRSSSLLAAANGCATLGLIILSSTLMHYALGFNKHFNAIHDLNVVNREDFSTQIDQNYGDMQGSIATLRSYLDRRKQPLDEGEEGLQLLREDVEAVQALQSYSTMIQSHREDSKPIVIESTEPVNTDQIQSFFVNLEKLASKGKKGTLAGAFLGAGYLSCAYANRAYLMVMAGFTFTAVNGLLFSVVHSYEAGARVLQNADENEITEVFNNAMAGKLFPKVANSITLQNAIVIPLERLLKLIPS